MKDSADNAKFLEIHSKRFGNGIEIMGIEEVNKKFEIDSPIKVIDYLHLLIWSYDPIDLMKSNLNYFNIVHVCKLNPNIK